MSNPEPARVSRPIGARRDSGLASPPSSYHVLKRLSDVAVSAIGLLLMAPALAVIAAIIKLDSRGPMLFRQERIGRGFRPFSLYKFRTMVTRPVDGRAPLTVGADPRITRFGRLLRAMKIDEVPQLFNVLKGDMSLVGPRPEVPKYVDMFREEYASILTVRPGLTDPATLKYCDESDLLANAADPEREYVERILPDKLNVARQYVQHATFSVDATIIVKTVVESVWRNTVPVKKAVLRRRRPLVVAIHLVIAVASNLAAFWLRFDGMIPPAEVDRFVRLLPLLLLCRGVFFVPFRLYEGLWRYTSIWDLRNIIGGVTSSSFAFFLLVRLVAGDTAYPRSVFLVDALVAVTVMGGLRLVNRAYGELIAAARPGRRVVIFGAGDLGEMALRSLKKGDQCSVIGFIDDDAMKVGQRIHGVPVLGTRYQIGRIITKYRPHEVLIAVSHSDPKVVRSIVRALEPYKLPITTMPELRDLKAPSATVVMRNLTIGDLLARAPINLDVRRLERLIAGRSVILTGAGGSIGSELARQIAALGPATLVLVDRYENGLYAVANELRSAGPCGFVEAIADVTDAPRMRSLFAQHQPHIVFHAAAHKHVPLMEHNPCEAVKNNVRGTRIVVETAIQSGARHFVLISTDKAVNPSSVMGATKRVAELLIQHYSIGCGTACSVVRFGNVLGSNGSVVPLFLQQIERGGPVTVTHPEMRRYFMLIPEAVQLVLHAAALDEDGGMFVLDMGEQVKLLDLARDLIRLTGYVPEEEIPILFNGVRPGEKLYEELSSDEEVLEPAGVEKIMRVRALRYPSGVIAAEIERLEQEASVGDAHAVIRQLRRIVPSFTSDWPPEATERHFPADLEPSLSNVYREAGAG